MKTLKHKHVYRKIILTLSAGSWGTEIEAIKGLAAENFES
jgi:hypothetical protein